MASSCSSLHISLLGYIVYVVVQFFLWFHFYFPLFFFMLIYDNEYEKKATKNWTKDKIEQQHNSTQLLFQFHGQVTNPRKGSLLAQKNYQWPWKMVSWESIQPSQNVLKSMLVDCRSRQVHNTVHNFIHSIFPGREKRRSLFPWLFQRRGWLIVQSTGFEKAAMKIMNLNIGVIIKRLRFFTSMITSLN